MNRIVLFILLTGLVFSGEVLVLTVDGVINPVSSEYIIEGIEEAEEMDAAALVIRLDTPGGLMSSMEDINKAILASRVPVIVYIWPSGGRAASAGTFISYASHLSAMTRSTRIGAAHPVSMGGLPGQEGDKPDTVMTAKMTNDAVAQILSFAKRRGRNIEWAESAVRQAVSIDEAEAESLGVVEYIAENLDELLLLAHGDTVEVDGDTLVLALRDVKQKMKDMDVKERFLYTIFDPNIAYMLLLAGLLGIFFELKNPGGIVPGVVGGISLLLALYAFQMLPVNYVGILLIVLGLGLIIAETQVPGIGILAIGGVVALILGSFLLTEGAPDFLSISAMVIWPTVIFVAGVLIFLVYKFAEVQKGKSSTGQSGLVGMKGEAKKDSYDGQVKVFIRSELWTAETNDTIIKGDKVEVVRVDGLKLHVKKI